jgi:transcriptional regulator with XRE-family HTH domain
MVLFRPFGPHPVEECEPTYDLIGARVADTRQGVGLSQEVVAQAVGIPRSALSDIENGKRAVSAVELWWLSRLLGRTTDWLLTGEHRDIPHEALGSLLNRLSSSDVQVVFRVVKGLAKESGVL